MANELTVSTSVSLTTPKGETYQMQSTFRADHASEKVLAGTQSVGITMEPLELGDVPLLGPFEIKNLDATNFVQVGIDDSGFVPLFDILPGEAFVMPRPASGVTLQVKADTGACDIRVLLTDATSV